VHILYVHKTKVMFCQCGIINLFCLNNLLNLIFYNIFLNGLFLNFFHIKYQNIKYFFEIFLGDSGLGQVYFIQNLTCNWPEVNRPTCWVNPKLKWPEKNPVETFYKKKMCFSWLLTYFKVHYINTRRIFYFCNVKFETL
jgi:hypothetical protein